MKPATPVCYLNPQIGAVYVAAKSGPPLMVRPWQEGDDPHDKHIVLEFEDLILRVEKRLGVDHPDAILRLCLHLADSRKLCHHLISRLAESGDRVARLIGEKMNAAMDQVRAIDERTLPLAFVTLHAKTPFPWPAGPRPLTFSLQWPATLPVGQRNVLTYQGVEFHIPPGQPETFSKEHNPDARRTIAVGGYETLGVETALTQRTRLLEREALIAMLTRIRDMAHHLNLFVKIQEDCGLLKSCDLTDHYLKLLEPFGVA